MPESKSLAASKRPRWASNPRADEFNRSKRFRSCSNCLAFDERDDGLCGMVHTIKYLLLSLAVHLAVKSFDIKHDRGQKDDRYGNE